MRSPCRLAHAQAYASTSRGTKAISQATRRLIGGLFELDDLGPQLERTLEVLNEVGFTT